MSSDDRPFNTIESAQQFLALLAEAVDEALEEARAERQACRDNNLERRAEAWQLVAYTLTRLSSNVTSSRRLMNDLRTLRNLLERRSAIGQPASTSRRASESGGDRDEPPGPPKTSP
jgi:hypothetical protein